MKKIKKLLFSIIFISISSSIAAFELTISNLTPEAVRVMSIKFLMSSNVPINVDIKPGQSRIVNIPDRFNSFCVESFNYIPNLSTNKQSYIKFERPLCKLQKINITPEGISSLSQRF